jgi:hypothetical protein
MGGGRFFGVIERYRKLLDEKPGALGAKRTKKPTPWLLHALAQMG